MTTIISRPPTQCWCGKSGNHLHDAFTTIEHAKALLRNYDGEDVDLLILKEALAKVTRHDITVRSARNVIGRFHEDQKQRQSVDPRPDDGVHPSRRAALKAILRWRVAVPHRHEGVGHRRPRVGSHLAPGEWHPQRLGVLETQDNRTGPASWPCPPHDWEPQMTKLDWNRPRPPRVRQVDWDVQRSRKKVRRPKPLTAEQEWAKETALAYTGRFGFMLGMQRNARFADWRPTPKQVRAIRNCSVVEISVSGQASLSLGQSTESVA